MEVGVCTATARATPVIEESNCAELFAKRAAGNPGFADYEEKAVRVIALVGLIPKS